MTSALLRGATVADLVNQAGGPTPYTNRRRIMVRQPDVNAPYTSMAATFEEEMMVTLRDNAVVRVLTCAVASDRVTVQRHDRRDNRSVVATRVSPFALYGSTDWLGHARCHECR